MKIDFETHIIPKEYIKKLEKRSVVPRIERDDRGRMYMAYWENVRYPITEELYDPDVKIRDMETAGVNAQVLSLPITGADWLDSRQGSELARLYNNSVAEMIRDYPGRFVGSAALPLQDVKQAVIELQRAVDELGFKAVTVYSNVAQKPVASERFYPLYEMIEKLDIPILLHPTVPVMGRALKDYKLLPAIGFPMDTTIAIMTMIMSGLLDKYPHLNFVLPHLGGVFPFLMARIDKESCKIPGWGTSRLPSNYLKRVYVDTVSLHQPAMLCAYTSMGVERIVFGSDYPYWDIPSCVKSVEELPIPENEKQKIFCDTPKQLLKMA
jgi:predicted TIM-barrel fold metal-dependent hydrolase